MPRTTPCIRATVTIRVNGQRHSLEKRFPVGTPPATIDAWKLTARAERIATLPTPLIALVGARTLAADALQYLATVRTMPSYEARKADLMAWLPRFGQRDRRTITHVELQLQLSDWKASGYAASTINHRRHALAAVYELFDPDLPSPVNRTTWAAPPPLQARALAWPDILAIVAALPDTGPAAVLRVMAFTGFPQARISRLRPCDVQDSPPQVFLEGRRKGAGTVSKSLPISRDALDAIHTLFRHYPQGGICTKNAWAQAFRKAVSLVNADRGGSTRPPLPLSAVPYDLRHSFGTRLYAVTGDLNAVAEALDVTLETAQRYTLGAVKERVVKAIAVMDADREARLAAEAAKPRRGRLIRMKRQESTR